MPDLKKLITLEALQAALPSWLKSSSKPSYTADEISDTNTTNKFVTSADKSNWNAKGTYSKPTGGIPKTDLSSLVQSSLDKADSAVQTETDPTVPSWAKQTNKPSYTQDEVTDGTTYKRVTSTEKSTWNNKQSALTTTQMQAVNSGINSTKVGQISTNQTNILYAMQNGVKNVLPFTAQSMTHDNVTFTRNSDGSITVNSNGAISANKDLAFFEGKMSDIVKETGDYVLYGNSTNSRVKMWFYYTDNWAGVFSPDTSETDTYIIHSITKSDRPVIVRVKVESGTALSNVTIYPMFCTKAAWDQEPNVYRPFALPNTDLTQLVKTKAPALSTNTAIDSGSLDDVAENTFAVYASTVTNVPTSDDYYVETIVYDASNALQKAYNYTDGTSYVRVKNTATWGNWKQITNA